MRVLDLFAGIGGFSLAAHWMGWETAAFVEWDKFCQKVLAKNFPNVPIYGDIKGFHYEQEREKIGPIDLVCGGFPCQPFSHAGKRGGTSDDRYLWPEMLQVIGDVKPAWVVGENVAGLLSMDGGAVFEAVCASLEAKGYHVEAFVLPAISRGASHRRDRVWIVANRNSEDECQTKRTPNGQRFWAESCQCDCNTTNAEITEREQPRRTWSGREGFTDGGEQSRLVGNPNKPRLERYRGYDQRPGEWFIGAADSKFRHTWNAESARTATQQGVWQGTQTVPVGAWSEHWYEAATRICSVDDGVPGGLVQPVKNRTKILKAAGNAIVPQVVYELFRAIEAHELSRIY